MIAALSTPVHPQMPLPKMTADDDDDEIMAEKESKQQSWYDRQLSLIENKSDAEVEVWLGHLGLAHAGKNVRDVFTSPTQDDLNYNKSQYVWTRFVRPDGGNHGFIWMLQHIEDKTIFSPSGGRPCKNKSGSLTCTDKF